MAGDRPSLLIMSFSPLVSDARVLRQIRLFQHEGHAVTTLGYGPAPDGVVEHLQLPDEAISWHKDRRLLILRRFEAAYRTSPVVVAATALLGGRRGRYDVVLADDIDTLPLALDLAPRGGVHVDLHEYHPRQNEELRRWALFVAPYYRWLVRTYGVQSDSATTVGQGIAREYEREFGLACGVVMNAPYRRDDLSPTPVSWPPRLVHAGNGVAARLEVMLEAMSQVTNGATLDLYLIDQGNGYVPVLRERFADSDRVRIHDPVPTAEIVSTLNSYDAGVYSLPPISFNFRWAMPNKFFDFVQARLALVIGPSPEMAGLVEKHQLGVVAQDFTPEAFAAAINALTPETLAAAKAASHEAARVLCAEEQVHRWTEPVAALAARAQR
ncbi:glycosyltransferase family 4 protein [Ornithinimicrobium ciconiae]|uniref:Glycosyltransferase family 4 protein n=1 Tax=Ornithinimicrobium ciconiae TaxID=2594265 RepID=A0A516GAI9_9MICO|nr:glycosyltransferase family 4 protein [Ornithinimicrobium ciconiae]QDO88525.1 glycosyltransferase family 4 protein [Ornithinimicrobium ciconiae]